tara:strand:+ start:4531 stop:5811 length:1281 start_codon:yes stop_codon:yes gene_type:complete
MTEEAFIFMHQQSSGIVNPRTKLSINVTAAEPSPTGVVTSMVLGRDALSINGNYDITDLNSVLEQIERIKFTFVIDNGNNIDFDVEITNRAYYENGGEPFFYFLFTPVTLPDIENTPYSVYISQEPAQYQEVEVTFTPYLLNITFGFSEYNATISNAIENRKSEIRVESDRVEDTVLPANWEAIINGSASPATVQDSLYYDTGWTNGRYNGTDIDAGGNAGITPAFTGTPFRGEVFSRDTNNAFICSTARKQVDYVDLLHTSTTPLPTFTTGSIGATIALTAYPGNFMKASDTVLYLNTLAEVDAPGIEVISKNTILLFQNLTDPSIYELMRVSDIDTTTSPTQYTVQRGYGDTTAVSYTVGTSNPAYLVSPFDIFLFEQENVKYVRLINSSKILVQGNSTIVDTDDYGNVINSFECQYIEYIVTD